MRLHVRTVPIELHAPLVEYLGDHPDAIAWLQDGGGFVASGVAARLDPGPGPDRIHRAAATWAQAVADAEVDDRVGVPGSGPVAFGSFTFADDAPASVLVVPELVVGQRDGRAWVTRIDAGAPVGDDVVAPPARPVATATRDRPRFAGSTVPDVVWLEAVARAVAEIRDGDLDKVVLARDHAVWSRTAFDPRLLCRRLETTFPGCFTFLVAGLIGATPELLVRRVGAEVSSLTLAGSAARGADAAEDERLGAELLASEKDRWEHRLAAASVEATLSSRCDRLTAGDGAHLLRLDNVQHLATRFTGRLRDPSADSALTLAARLHPTAAVGGAPTAEALASIRTLEGMDRGRYAGPVGWVDGRGDGEWGIALRCAELAGARARLVAGAGIVAGSLPEDELEETRLKLRAMLDVLDASG